MGETCVFLSIKSRLGNCTQASFGIITSPYATHTNVACYLFTGTTYASPFTIALPPASGDAAVPSGTHLPIYIQASLPSGLTFTAGGATVVNGSFATFPGNCWANAFFYVVGSTPTWFITKAC